MHTLVGRVVGQMHTLVGQMHVGQMHNRVVGQMHTLVGQMHTRVVGQMQRPQIIRSTSNCILSNKVKNINSSSKQAAEARKIKKFECN